MAGPGPALRVMGFCLRGQWQVGRQPAAGGGAAERLVRFFLLYTMARPLEKPPEHLARARQMAYTYNNSVGLSVTQAVPE